MNDDELQKHLEEAKQRLNNGALPKKLLEEYSTKLEMHEAFFIVTQAQIQLKEEKYKK
jgi:hypothetical protein